MVGRFVNPGSLFLVGVACEADESTSHALSLNGHWREFHQLHEASDPVHVPSEQDGVEGNNIEQITNKIE
jgi:hypothetical protein